MTTSFLAYFHYIALAVGFSGICIRYLSLRDLTKPNSQLGNVFLGDNLWGIAAALWLTTGLLRAFAGYEKGTDYYLANTLFWVKVALFIAIFVLEIYPMITLIRWRLAKKNRMNADDSQTVVLLRKISLIQILIILIIPLIASLMARGVDIFSH